MPNCYSSAILDGKTKGVTLCLWSSSLFNLCLLPAQQPSPHFQSPDPANRCDMLPTPHDSVSHLLCTSANNCTSNEKPELLSCRQVNPLSTVMPCKKSAGTWYVIQDNSRDVAYIHMSATGISAGARKWQVPHAHLGSPEELENVW